jgi:hypothetical protein
MIRYPFKIGDRLQLWFPQYERSHFTWAQTLFKEFHGAKGVVFETPDAITVKLRLDDGRTYWAITTSEVRACDGTPEPVPGAAVVEAPKPKAPVQGSLF